MLDPVHFQLDKWRDKDGKYITYAEGYPVIYLDKEGNVLCPDCANAEEDERKDPDYIPGPDIEAADIYYEGPDIECDGHCGKMISSAYGDPEEEDEEDEVEVEQKIS